MPLPYYYIETEFRWHYFYFSKEKQGKTRFRQNGVQKMLLFKRLNPIHIKQIALFDANWVDILN